MNDWLFRRKDQREKYLEEFLYGKKTPEPIAEKLLDVLGYCCVGGYISGFINQNLPLALLSLGLGWGSLAVKRYVLKTKI